jgi:hypothetical protein
VLPYIANNKKPPILSDHQFEILSELSTFFGGADHASPAPVLTTGFFLTTTDRWFFCVFKGSSQLT